MNKWRFLTDTHWYGAVLLAIAFWIAYGLFISPLVINDVLINFRIFLFSALLYPIIEEIVFRGVIQTYFGRQPVLNQDFIGLSAANVLTSLIFAVSHLYNHEVLWALMTFFPSLVFGYFKDRHQTLMPSISLHVFYNIGFFTLIAQ